MRFILNFFVLFCVFYAASALTYVRGTEKMQTLINPDHPDKCWLAETKKAYSVGESYYPDGVCKKYTCESPSIYIVDR